MHGDMIPKPIQILYSFEEDSKIGLFLLFFWSISSHINSNCSPSSLFHLSLERGSISEYKWDQRKRCHKSHLQMLLGKQTFLDCLPCPVPVPEKPIDQLLKQWSTTSCKSLQILYHWVKTRVKAIGSLLKFCFFFFFLQKERKFIFLLHHSSLNICTFT